ncbi:MAG: type II restriction endonuclease [Phycisphaerae bacterium]|nr:type II restriction endonuclease [Phycisphaerae bacterium]MDD5380820.1 type II restriction endonuclease [Phycisphaerae bacterium]
MKYSDIFKDKINCTNSDEVFEYLLNTLKDTVTRWDYFVNWAKVFDNLVDVEVDLNILNYLIGKDNIEEEFGLLLDKHPSISRLIPILIACRESKFSILTSYDKNSFKYETYNFGKLGSIEKSKIIEFAKCTGFLDLLETKRIKNIVDYVIGVEVGLDSNGRKNRGGTSMETIVEFFVKDICYRKNLQYIKEATSKNIQEKWGLKLRVDKSSRRVDFAINNSKKLVLIETNFYSGGGSKLKSTAGEYKSIFDFWKSDGHEFIWITDGYGWRSTHLPLRETFNHTDYLLNLDMVAKGLLEDIVTMTHK